ncbi:ParB/RepB/Spo0J family partition protein [Klebsiella pasteurii]|uniref:ParB/RepB/Spo0J family partition protein n=1 Tax=Klebsiella pasteurii TaxID=2587529 RepID=UPI001C7D39E1|nr:DNA-binding protein [Klebsiella pasteurii]
MSSLYQHYNQKDKNGTGIKVNRTFIVPLKELYVEPGLNIRDIDQEHVAEFRDAFIAGESVPPLDVQVTEKGVKVIDGHHRYYGAIEATKAGADVIRLECKDFVGSEADRIAFMVTRNQGWEPDEIAKKVKRSLSDVDYHLHLLTCGEELISMVRAGEVSPTTAVALSREHGPQAASVAVRQMDKARASGKSKLTRSAALPQFSSAKARQFIQIVAEQVDLVLPAEASAILDEYRAFLKEAGWESEA